MLEKNEHLELARARVQLAKHLIFFTGAGMSAESGVPTYRGKGGIWKSYDYEQYACQDAFDRDPEGVWEFHNYRRALVAECRPNAGHHLIADLSEQRPCTVITQNIDGLHQKAGSSPVLELHGSLWRVRCPKTAVCHFDDGVPFNGRRSDGLWWRPDIVWFGDALDEKVIESSLAEAVRGDVFISIGTSASVFPAAHMPIYAKQAGAFLIEINPEATPMSHLYDQVMRSSASDALTRLFEG